MSDAPNGQRRAELGSKILVIGLVGIFVFAMFGFTLAVIDAGGEEPTEPPPPSLPALTEPSTIPEPAPEAAVRSRVLLALAETEPSPSPSPTPSDEPTEAAAPATASAEPSAEPVTLVETTMPVVPVASFWSKRDGLRSSRVARALETGKAPGFERVMVEAAIADDLAHELDVTLHEDVRRGDPARVARAVSKGALGLISAVDLTPSMRALKVDGRSLTGNDRITDLEEWPLLLELERAEGEGWDQARTWVLVAGGDSFTDRGVYDTVVRKGKGVDYPFDGGTAKVTGHGCCDPVFNDNIVPRYVLTGNKGLVRKLFKRAELAIANHEQPVTDAASFHTSGLRFSGKPELTRIFARAGIDWLSLANNHIGDYGADGIKDSRRIMRKYGIAFGGAGADLEQARKISYFDIGDTRVALVACLGIVKAYWADEDKAGATPCLDRYIVKDVKRARREGEADVVIVFPHWGVEYTRRPLPSMRKHAARWVKAGADMVIGAHSHHAGAIEDIEGAPVLYSLGNLIFDQHWSTDTMESVLLEATFQGDRLIEMRLRPYIIHDTSQPNLLDPATGEGRRLLRSIRSASEAWLDW